MANYTANTDFDSVPVALPIGVTRVGDTSRVYSDTTTVRPGGGVTLSGASVTLLAPNIRSGTTGSTSGVLNFSDSTLWLQGTGGGAQDFGRSNVTGERALSFTWTNGQINYGGTASFFLRMRDFDHVLNIANTTVNNFNTAANMGFNIARIDIDSSSIAGAVFNGVWFNSIADLVAIGSDFSNSIFRTGQNYHIRVNPAISAATRGAFYVGANFGNFGTLPGGSTAGLQMFNVVSGAAGANFRGVFLIDCAIPATGNLLVGSEVGGAGRSATVITAQAWRPLFRRPDLVTTTDVRLKKDTGTNILYSAPATITNTTDVNSIAAANRSLINERGYYRRDQVVTISPTNTSGNIAYTCLLYTSPSPRD